MAVSRSPGELERVAEEVRALGRSARAVALDVTHSKSVRQLVSGLPRLDVLVVSAGTNVPEPLLDVSDEHLDELLAVNVRAAFVTVQAAARRMVEAGGGSIVLISSQMGHVGAGERSVYCTTKHAVEGLTKAAAVELGPHRVRVNAVAPTFVETPMTAPFLADAAFRADVERRIPLGRLGRVEDVTGGGGLPRLRRGGDGHRDEPARRRRLDGAVTVPARTLLGEGPVWDPRRGELVWVDIDRGLVHRRSAGGEEMSLDVGQPVGCAVPRATGGLALALRDGFALLPAGGGEPRLVAAVEHGRADTRMNDGGCDSRGRFWAGTMSLAGDTRTAALYRLDADLTVTRVLPGVSISNGLGWSPEDRLDVPRGHSATQDRRVRVRRRPGHDRLPARRDPGGVGSGKAGRPGRGRRGRHLGGALGRRGRAALHAGGAAGCAPRPAGEPGHELLLRRSRPGHVVRDVGRSRCRTRAAGRLAVRLPSRSARDFPPRRSRDRRWRRYRTSACS